MGKKSSSRRCHPHNKDSGSSVTLAPNQRKPRDRKHAQPQKRIRACFGRKTDSQGGERKEQTTGKNSFRPAGATSDASEEWQASKRTDYREPSNNEIARSKRQRPPVKQQIVQRRTRVGEEYRP